MGSEELDKIERAEELLKEVEQSRKRGLIDPLIDGVKFTKEYVDNLRNKVSELRMATREDMENFRETLSVLKDTIGAIKSATSKEDLENFRATMKTVNETMTNVRDTVESIRKTAETVREILIMANMLKKAYETASAQKAEPGNSADAHAEARNLKSETESPERLQ